jgi:hypothetical protein
MGISTVTGTTNVIDTIAIMIATGTTGVVTVMDTGIETGINMVVIAGAADIAAIEINVSGVAHEQDNHCVADGGADVWQGANG